VNWMQASGVITPYVNRDGEDVRLSEFELWFEGWEFSSFIKEDLTLEDTPDAVDEFFASTPQLDQ
jgi:hypothetical protein